MDVQLGRNRMGPKTTRLVLPPYPHYRDRHFHSRLQGMDMRCALPSCQNLSGQAVAEVNYS